MASLVKETSCSWDTVTLISTWLLKKMATLKLIREKSPVERDMLVNFFVCKFGYGQYVI